LEGSVTLGMVKFQNKDYSHIKLKGLKLMKISHSHSKIKDSSHSVVVFFYQHSHSDELNKVILVKQ